jgi:hypothetical protein
MLRSGVLSLVGPFQAAQGVVLEQYNDDEHKGFIRVSAPQ